MSWSCELGDGSPLPKSPLENLKEFFTKRYESNIAGYSFSSDQGARGHGRERFNLDAAIFYGKRIIPCTLAMWIIAFTPGINPNFINNLPEAMVLGIGSGVALSVLFGLERRRYL